MDGPAPSWSSAEIQQAANFVPDRFADESLRTAAIAIDTGMKLESDVLKILGRAIAKSEATIRFRDVAHAMSAPIETYRVVFNVHARVPLACDVQCDPFGGASEVVLIAGENRFDADAHSLELIEVAISVPYSFASFTEINGASEFQLERRGALRISYPAFDHARRLLDHVLVVLRLKGIETNYLDLDAGRGPPFACSIVRQFKDGTTVPITGCGPAIGHLLSPSALGRNPSRIGRPLVIEPRTLQRAYDDAATELALVANSWVLAEIDHFRRLALIIESGFFGDPWEGALRNSRAFQELLESVRAKDPTVTAGISDVVAELVWLRNWVSHLQVRANGGPSRNRFGIDVYDIATAERLRRLMPLAEALADVIVRGLVHRDAISQVNEREPPFHELAALWESKATYCTTSTGTLALARCVKAVLPDGQHHPRVTEITRSIDATIARLERRAKRPPKSARTPARRRRA
jgi:hypothetical protein